MGSKRRTDADRLEAWGIPHLVVDPVMVSKGGVALLQPDAVESLKKDLLPFATVVTPNIPKASGVSAFSTQLLLAMLISMTV